VKTSYIQGFLICNVKSHKPTMKVTVSWDSKAHFYPEDGNNNFLPKYGYFPP
jgi:hypothetical protein